MKSIRQFLFILIFLQFVGCLTPPGDADPFEVKVVVLIIAALVIVFGTIKENSGRKKSREKHSYYNSLDDSGKEIYDKVSDIQTGYLSAERVFTEMFKASKMSSDIDYKKEQCAHYIKNFENAINERNSQLNELKIKYGKFKVEGILKQFEWNHYVFDKINLNYSRSKATL